MDALKHCNLILHSSLAPQILVINASLLYVGILPSHVPHQKAEKQRGVREEKRRCRHPVAVYCTCDRQRHRRVLSGHLSSPTSKYLVSIHNPVYSVDMHTTR